MDCKSFWKNALPAALLLSFGFYLFTAPVAATDDPLFIEPGLISDGTSNTAQFSEQVSNYESDCESWRDEARPSAEKISRCLQAAKNLKNKFGGFRQAYESIGGKIKNAGKWTKKLDEEYEKNFARNNGDSRILGYVKKHGGFRSAYQKSGNLLRQFENGLDQEIRDLTAIGDGSVRNISSNSGFSGTTFVAAVSESNRQRAKPLAKAKCVVYFIGNFGCGLINAACPRTTCAPD